MMPGDPLVGGVALRRPAIRSPNYVAGSVGWTINADGTVEFNSGTFRGTVTAGTFAGTDFIINSSGAFFYSGTPALGNLIASIASVAGFDQFGNGYQAGITSNENTFGTSTNIFGSGMQFQFPTATPVQIAISPNGLLVYKSPGGAAGNLIVSLARAAGTDQFGNNFPAGFNCTAGTISGTTFSGTDFIINSAGAFFYSGTPALGNLIATIAIATGTDSFGNTYYPGLATYSNAGILPIALLNNGSLESGIPSQFAGTGSPGGVLLNAAGQVEFESGTTNNVDTPAFITAVSRQSSGIAAAFLDVGGVIALEKVGQPNFFSGLVTMWNDNGGNGFLKYKDGDAGSQWQVGSNTFYTTGTQQFTSTSQATVSGLNTGTLGPGVYLVRLKLWYKPSGTIGSFHQTFMNFSGSASANFNGVTWQATSTSTATNQSTVTGLGIGSGDNSPTHAAFPGWTELEGILTVTGSGVLSVAIALALAGDDVTTQPGSYLIVRPLP